MEIENNCIKRVYSGDIKNGTVIIPDSITKIGDRAFEECEKLISINISNSITEIGNHAFKDCVNLKSIKTS